MCGVVGILGTGPVNLSLYDALLVLQHRGQDAAGISTCEGNRISLRKDAGLVKDVFKNSHMLELRGNMGIGHVRYPTAGTSSRAEAQPFYVNSPYGLVLAHNGNLTNAEDVKREFLINHFRHLNTGSDSELLLNVLAHQLQQQGQRELDETAVFSAIKDVMKICHGGYAVVLMIPGFGIIGFRDPHGIRPLVYGVNETDQGMEYMLASESVALRSVGFQLLADVAPGEVIIFTVDGKVHRQVCAEKTMLSPCLFEFVYFARPDSIIDNISVHKARSRMGKKLAEKIQRDYADLPIDVVIPIPDTSRTAALQLAGNLDIKYSEGFLRNRYIGRTFIMPGQQIRRKSVRRKLSAIDLEFRRKNVLLVDDSIVRGTTSQQIIQLAREAGARKVFFASAAPPVRFPNVYGIDMPAAHELIAHGRNEAQIREELGADELIYQELPDLIDAVQKKGKSHVDRFDASVFDGDYVVGDITPEYLEKLEQQRQDHAKTLAGVVTETVLDAFDA